MATTNPFSIGQNLGWQGNPLYDALSSRRNALIGLGAGLASGNDWGQGLGQGLQLAQTGAARDDALAMVEQEQAKEQEILNKTTEWLRQNGQTQWLAAVESGAFAPGDAYHAILKAQMDGGPNGVVINGQLVDPATGRVIGDYRDESAGPALSGLPSSYQEYVLSTQDPNYAQFRSTAVTPKAPTEAERKAGALTTVTQKDAALLFGDNTTQKPGIFDALGGTVDQSLQVGAFGVNPLAGFASSDFKVAKDAINNITQSYLYAMSGATAPPEEVAKIADAVTPKPLDSPDQKKAKRDRLFAMYSAIEGAQGNAAPPQTGGYQVIGVEGP